MNAMCNYIIKNIKYLKFITIIYKNISEDNKAFKYDAISMNIIGQSIM